MATESAETRKRERAFIQAFHMDRNLGDVAIRNKLTLDQFASLVYLPPRLRFRIFRSKGARSRISRPGK